MAMITTTGTVESLLVAPALGKLLLRDETDGMVEQFLLWSGEPAETVARIIHGMQVSLCREALLQGKRVEVSHEEASAAVAAVRLNAA
jgi:hypothetical protein